MNCTILICDDDNDILELLELYLEKEGYNIVKASDGVEGINAVGENDIDIALIDIMMPGLNGFKLIRKIRETSDIPIIVLSARDEDIDKILGLDLGADDYVCKPFNPLEIVARVKAHVRRLNKSNRESGENEKIIVGDIILNLYESKVEVKMNEIVLTSMEYKIIKYLMMNKGRILTKTQIFEEVWGEEFFRDDNMIMVYISKLREKIEDNPKKPRYLKTIRGLGYKFEKSVEV